MCLTTFLPHLQELTLETVTGDADHLTVVAIAGAPTAACPLCQHPSRRVHSTYGHHRRSALECDAGHPVRAGAPLLLHEYGVCPQDLL